jgi:hypothetical protein
VTAVWFLLSALVLPATAVWWAVSARRSVRRVVAVSGEVAARADGWTEAARAVEAICGEVA